MMTVTQADRDRAAGYYFAKRGHRILADNIRQGYVDDDSLVVLLAHHREAAIAAVKP
jgi:hypothetical protein